jgi:hypothetical protein
MKRSYLLIYQLLTGLSDTSTGLLLIVAPELTLRLMRVTVPASALPYLSYIGAFVLSVGVACLYGAALTRRILFSQKLEVVWLLTAITRACVAVFVLAQCWTGHLALGWLTVAATDGAFALFQAIGLWKGWLNDVGG